jgi:hypothetical protein
MAAMGFIPPEDASTLQLVVQLLVRQAAFTAEPAGPHKSDGGDDSLPADRRIGSNPRYLSAITASEGMTQLPAPLLSGPMILYPLQRLRHAHLAGSIHTPQLWAVLMWQGPGLPSLAEAMTVI